MGPQLTILYILNTLTRLISYFSSLIFVAGRGSIAKRMTKKIGHCSRQINKKISEYNTFGQVPATGNLPTVLKRADVVSEETDVFSCLDRSGTSDGECSVLKRSVIKEAHLFNRATEELDLVKSDMIRGYEYLRSQHSVLLEAQNQIDIDSSSSFDRAKSAMIKSEIINLENFIRGYVTEVGSFVELPEMEYTFYKVGNETMFDLICEEDVVEIATLLKSVRDENLCSAILNDNVSEKDVFPEGDITEVMQEVHDDEYSDLDETDEY